MFFFFIAPYVFSQTLTPLSFSSTLLKVVVVANHLFKQGRVVSGEPLAVAEVEKMATPKAMKVNERGLNEKE